MENCSGHSNTPELQDQLPKIKTELRFFQPIALKGYDQMGIIFLIWWSTDEAGLPHRMDLTPTSNINRTSSANFEDEDIEIFNPPVIQQQYIVGKRYKVKLDHLESEEKHERESERYRFT